METKVKEKIAILLKRKRNNDELERCLDLYGKIDEFIEDNPSVFDKIRTAIKPHTGPKTILLSARRSDMINREIDIEVGYKELMCALRDYYEWKIYELTKDE